MNKLIFALTMSYGIQASAIRCETDAECFSKAISLIKKATKLGACTAEVNEVAMHVEWESAATVQGKAEILDECIYRANKKAKLQKGHAKRVERLKKAMAK